MHTQQHPSPNVAYKLRLLKSLALIVNVYRITELRHNKGSDLNVDKPVKHARCKAAESYIFFLCLSWSDSHILFWIFLFHESLTIIHIKCFKFVVLRFQLCAYRINFKYVVTFIYWSLKLLFTINKHCQRMNF